MPRLFTNRGLLAIGAALLSTPVIAATEYRFHVSCASRTMVVEWKTGDVDPGRELLRIVTGLDNPDCNISDYEKDTDAR